MDIIQELKDLEKKGITIKFIDSPTVYFAIVVNSFITDHCYFNKDFIIRIYSDSKSSNIIKDINSAKDFLEKKKQYFKQIEVPILSEISEIWGECVKECNVNSSREELVKPDNILNRLKKSLGVNFGG